MIKLQFPALLFALLFAGSAFAQAPARSVGPWLTRTESDPFGGGKTAVAAVSSGSDTLAIRCFGDRLSVILILPTNKRDFAEGQDVDYAYRADDGAIANHEGRVFGDYSVELANAAQIFGDAQKSSQLAFRVTLPGGLVRTIRFSISKAQKALTDVRAGCGAGAARASSAPQKEAADSAPATAPIAPNVPVDGRVDEATIERVRKQLWSDAVSAAAHLQNCDALKLNTARMGLALMLTGETATERATDRLAAAAAEVRAGLVKTANYNLCAEAWVKFGPLGTLTRDLVETKLTPEQIAAPAKAQ